MKSELTIRIARDGEKEIELSCPFGTIIDSVVGHFSQGSSPLAAVKANGKILPLSARLEVNSRLEPVLLESPEGVAVYRYTLAFLLAAAANNLFPEKSLYIGHSLGNSYYYTFLEGNKPEKNEIDELQKRMRELVKQDLAIECYYMAYSEAMEIFSKKHQDDTALLLNERSESKVMVNECTGFIDLYISPLVNRTGLLEAFELLP